MASVFEDSEGIEWGKLDMYEEIVSGKVNQENSERGKLNCGLDRCKRNEELLKDNSPKE